MNITGLSIRGNYNLLKYDNDKFSIYNYYYNYKLPLLYGLIFGSISSYITSYVPIFYTEIVKILLNNEEKRDEINSYILSYILYKIGSNFFAGLRGYVFTKYINIICIQVKKDILDKLINTDLRYYLDNVNTEITELLISDSKKIADLYTLYMNVVVRNIIHIIVISYILILKSPYLYFVCMFLSSLQYIIQTIYIDKYYHKSVSNTNEIEINERKIISDYINKIITYRSLGLEDKIRNNIHILYNKYEIIKSKEAMFYGLMHLISGSINSTLQCILIFIGLLSNIDNKSLYEFTLYIDTITGIMKEFTHVRNDFVKNKLPLKKINNLFNTIEDDKIVWGDYKHNNIQKFEPYIHIKNVTFYYNDNNLLFNNINLDLYGNKIIGIKGDSGIGKSTLFKLLLGLYKPKSGDILIDNISILNYDKYYYYNSIVSYVGQEPNLLEGSILDNILINKNYDRYLYNILKDLISDIDIDNNNLSGGQKQRVAICRAIMKKPKILLLDEPTSALDINNEQKFMLILKKIIENYNITIIMISHKLHTLDNCDEIINFHDLIENKI